MAKRGRPRKKMNQEVKVESEQKNNVKPIVWITVHFSDGKKYKIAASHVINCLRNVGAEIVSGTSCEIEALLKCASEKICWADVMEKAIAIQPPLPDYYKEWGTAVKGVLTE